MEKHGMTLLLESTDPSLSMIWRMLLVTSIPPVYQHQP
jgi:hypothetical protein